jgi:hypothetical protein
MSKPQRWYEVEGETAYIYDSPFPQRSASISIIKRADLAFYRLNFRLTKVWA